MASASAPAPRVLWSQRADRVLLRLPQLREEALDRAAGEPVFEPSARGLIVRGGGFALELELYGEIETESAHPSNPTKMLTGFTVRESAMEIELARPRAEVTSKGWEDLPPRWPRLTAAKTHAGDAKIETDWDRFVDEDEEKDQLRARAAREEKAKMAQMEAVSTTMMLVCCRSRCRSPAAGAAACAAACAAAGAAAGAAACAAARAAAGAAAGAAAARADKSTAISKGVREGERGARADGARECKLGDAAAGEYSAPTGCFCSRNKLKSKILSAATYHSYSAPRVDLLVACSEYAGRPGGLGDRRIRYAERAGTARRRGRDRAAAAAGALSRDEADVHTCIRFPLQQPASVCEFLK